MIEGHAALENGPTPPTTVDHTEIVLAGVHPELVEFVISLLDPGLDWPSCRRTCRQWRRIVRELAAPALWMAAVLYAPNDVDSLRQDLEKVVRTADDFRLACLERQRIEFGDDEDYEPFNEWHHTWCRQDGGYLDADEGLLNSFTEENLANDSALATARIHLTLRDAHKLLDPPADPETPKQHQTVLGDAHFRFAGSQWTAQVVISWYNPPNNARGRSQPYWRIGITVGRMYGPANMVLDGRHEDGCKFSVNAEIPQIIRYRASFQAAGKTFNTKELDRAAQTPWLDMSYSSHCSTRDEATMRDGEFFDLAIARFALGPMCPHLGISLIVDHLAYGKYHY